jgi:DNA polymerase
MSWKSALRKTASSVVSNVFSVPTITPEVVDWARLVTVDFETYFSDDYTLRKLSTSEYVRDERFKAQMVGIKIGHKLTKWYPASRVRAALKAINWATHSVLCHNTQFDGFILSHHYGVVPLRYYDTLSMARGLHSNEIGAGLDEVAKFYGGAGKIDGILEQTKNVLDWPAALNIKAGMYCVQDVDETHRIFTLMHGKMPATEMALIHITMRMFCDPVLKVDIPRVEAELEREITRRRDTFYGVLDPAKYYEDKTVIKSRAERALTGEERDMLVFKRVFGSNEKLAEMLKNLGVDPPIKISPAWMGRSKEEREKTLEDKWTFAFSKTDLEFVNLPDLINEWRGKLDPDKAGDMMRIVAKQMRLRELVDCRIMVKSTTNVTRAERFLKAGADDMKLPVGYAYYRAHTGRWGGNNKMNMQNLTRGGELRLSIMAEKAHRIVVADSGQIEARVNAWLWNQDDLLAAFRNADGWDKSKGVARGPDRDAYCLFASAIYNREITTDDKTERFVGKVCVLGLGYQMGAAKLQITLARGALGGPPVHFTLQQCEGIVNTYRVTNNRIKGGWDRCKQIIEDMAVGAQGSWKCISWEANTIYLPNGLTLKYPDLKKSINDKGWEEWSYASGEMRSKIYGGLLCENLVQALARIIIGEQMVEIDKRDRVVMTTHDETVTHVKAREADKAFARMMKAMTTAPAWCSDIPLNAEGGHDINYSK